MEAGHDPSRIIETRGRPAVRKVPRIPVTYQGVTMSAHKWAEKIGISSSRFYKLMKAGHDPVEIIRTQGRVSRRGNVHEWHGIKLNVTEWADVLNVSRSFVQARLKQQPIAELIHELVTARDQESRFEDDEQAQQFVREHPDGATFEEIAEYFGITNQRVQQITSAALDKLRVASRVLKK